MPAQPEPYNHPTNVTFAKELEWHRTNAGLTKKELASKLGFAESFSGQIELRKNIPSEEFAAALDTFFATNGLFERLRKRIIESRHEAMLPPGYPEYLLREAKADTIHSFGLALVHGLLQTDEYARVMVSANTMPDMVEHFVAERMKRKEIFQRPVPPRTVFIMDEMVLRRPIGGPEVMRGQLDYLLEFGDRPMNTVLIIPNELGYHIGLGGSMTILGFDDAPSVGYTESSGIQVLREDPAGVQGLQLLYDSLRSYALPITESRNLMQSFREGLWNR